MNRFVTFLCLGFLGLYCVACSPSIVDPAARFPITIEIKLGAAAEIDGLSIHLVDVPRDGRCPGVKSSIPVVCPSAGIAEAFLRLGGAGSREIILNTNPHYQKSYQYDIYHITLVDLVPHPILHQTTKKSSYIAVLAIDVRR